MLFDAVGWLYYKAGRCLGSNMEKPAGGCCSMNGGGCHQHGQQKLMENCSDGTCRLPGQMPAVPIKAVEGVPIKDGAVVGKPLS